MDPQLYPYLAGIIGAAAAWGISYLQERNKGKSLDLEYVRGLIDEQIEDLRAERDRSRADMIGMRERIAVLESNIKELERSRESAITRLRHENEELRQQNTKLAALNNQLRVTMQLKQPDNR